MTLDLRRPVFLASAFLLAGAVPGVLGQTAPAPSDAAANSAAPSNQPATAQPPPGTPTTPAPGASGQNSVIQLSPFEVEAGKDSGYYAPNTLAGTRINSKIEDLGASISVVTKQQLIDTGAVDINDIFKYESNTEGIYDYTAFNASSPTNDSIQSAPQSAVRVRGLGVPNIAINEFVMTSRIPVDTYDLESVEIARGPNSTLFGIGQVSGTLNLDTLTANASRDFNTISNRLDSYGGWDNRIDLNRVLWRDKLAVRVAADQADYAYARKPSYDDVRRLYGTVEVHPTSKTNIQLIYEHYKENRQTPNFLTPRDGVTEWLADGSPTWNPLTYTATANGKTYVVSSSTNENNVPGTTGALPAGLYSDTTNYTRPSMYIDGGQVQLWEINRLDTSTNPTASSSSPVRMMTGSGSLYMRGDVNAATLYQTPGIDNKALYDWTKVNAVSPDWNYDHASLYTAIIEQELVHNLWLRGGYHLERSNAYNRSIINPPVLEIDTNQYLLDGRANPYLLRPFYQVNEPTIFETPEVNETINAQATYDLNFRDIGHSNWLKWLGEHRVLGYYERRHVTDETERLREAIIDPNHSWLTPGNLNYTNGSALDRPTYRYYVGPAGALGYTPGYVPPKSGVSGTFNLNYNLPNGSWISEPALFGTAPYVGGQTRQEINSRGFATQSYLLDDRLVITTGLRKDFTRSRNSNGAVLDPTTGVYDYGNLNNTWARWSSASGLTRTVGAVLKPFRWLGLFADKSDSFVPQAPAVDLFGNELPNTYGHGQDIGGYLSFFDDKLVLRLSFYRTTIVNDRSGDTTIGSRIARLETYDVTNIGGASDRFSFQWWAYNAASAQLNVPFTGVTTAPANVVSLANSWLQYDPRFVNALAEATAGQAIRGVNNTLGKGAELEIDWNPNPNWTFRLTGAQTKSVQLTLEQDLSDYLAERLPIWMNAHDAAGHYFWTSNLYGASQSAQSFYTSAVSVPVHIDQAFLGKSNPQVKEFSFRGLTKYTFSRGFFKRLSIGGDLRWDSRNVIGYLAAAPDPDGIVRSLDTNAPVYDPARFAGDLLANYEIPLRRGLRVDVQFNLENAFQGFQLRTTAVNPNGQAYNFRIIDPEQFVMTTTLHF